MALDTEPAPDREGQGDRDAQEHRVRTECEGDEDVGAGAHPAVQVDLRVAAHRVDDRGKRVEGADGAGKLSSSVVGHDDAGGTRVDHAACVAGIHHPFGMTGSEVRAASHSR